MLFLVDCPSLVATPQARDCDPRKIYSLYSKTTGAASKRQNNTHFDGDVAPRVPSISAFEIYDSGHSKQLRWRKRVAHGR